MRKTSISIWTSSDPLTEEQIKKRAVAVEDVDSKGLVKRHRVLEQTLFDMLFIRSLIDQAQHEASHLFMDSIARAGAVVRSANLDTEVFTPHSDVGKIIGERRMAFSGAYRRMVSDHGSGLADTAMRYFENVYSYPTEMVGQRRVAKLLNAPLNSLAQYYKTARFPDAREIIRGVAPFSRKREGGEE